MERAGGFTAGFDAKEDKFGYAGDVLFGDEGQMAIDVFYITSDGEKLKSDHQQRVHDSLLESLQE